MEATKNCSLAEAISYLTIATNAAIEEAGIQAEALPSESRQSVVNVQAAKVEEPLEDKEQGMKECASLSIGPAF